MLQVLDGICYKLLAAGETLKQVGDGAPSSGVPRGRAATVSAAATAAAEAASGKCGWVGLKVSEIQASHLATSIHFCELLRKRDWGSQGL